MSSTSATCARVSATRKVVDGLTLQVAKGEICGFLGANGSGKTTTIRMLCGLLVPDAGAGDVHRPRHRPPGAADPPRMSAT